MEPKPSEPPPLVGCLCVYLYNKQGSPGLSQTWTPPATSMRTFIRVCVCVNLGMWIRLRGWRDCGCRRCVLRLSWISDDMVTKETALWDLPVLRCNKRKSGQAPVASAVLHCGSELGRGGCKWEKGRARWRCTRNFESEDHIPETKLLSASRTKLERVSCDGMTLDMLAFHSRGFSTEHVWHRKERKTGVIIFVVPVSRFVFEQQNCLWVVEVSLNSSNYQSRVLEQDYRSLSAPG